MASFELGIARRGDSELIVQTLPDGSMALFEVATKNVYSLNPSAAAAWEACASATTLSRLAAAMSLRLNRPVTEDLAHEAVSELVAVGLVSVTPGERLGTSRRELLKQAAEVAIPVVLVLTGAEQRAHAQVAGSGLTTTPVPVTTSLPPGTTTTAPPGTTTTTTPPATTAAPSQPLRTFLIFKFVAPTAGSIEGRVPLAGAEFDVVTDPGGQVVGHMVTGPNGSASIQLTPGTHYKLIETFAPPALSVYHPFAPISFTMSNQDGFNFNLNNVLLSAPSG